MLRARAVGPRFNGISRSECARIGFALHSPISCQLDFHLSLRRVLGRRVVKRAESSMTAFVLWRGHRLLLFAGLGGLAIAFADPRAALAADPVAESTFGEPITVNLDQAKLLKLPERTATLIIGNPLIADAAVQPSGVVVLTAKSYGMTNLVVLDRSGATLVEYPIQVVGPSDAMVVVFRGVERESYSCAPVCERRITLGDSVGFFGANLNAVGAFGALANPEKK
jgi:hypothetical protein